MYAIRYNSCARTVLSRVRIDGKNGRSLLWWTFFVFHFSFRRPETPSRDQFISIIARTNSSNDMCAKTASFPWTLYHCRGRDYRHCFRARRRSPRGQIYESTMCFRYVRVHTSKKKKKISHYHPRLLVHTRAFAVKCISVSSLFTYILLRVFDENKKYCVMTHDLIGMFRTPKTGSLNTIQDITPL